MIKYHLQKGEKKGTPGNLSKEVNKFKMRLKYHSVL